jgi:hypothetical protein
MKFIELMYELKFMSRDSDEGCFDFMGKFEMSMKKSSGFIFFFSVELEEFSLLILLLLILLLLLLL